MRKRSAGKIARIRRRTTEARAEWNSLTKSERAARRGLLKKELAVRIGVARSEIFNTWFQGLARACPCGSSNAALRWFDTAWRDALRPGAP